MAGGSEVWLSASWLWLTGRVAQPSDAQPRVYYEVPDADSTTTTIHWVVFVPGELWPAPLLATWSGEVVHDRLVPAVADVLRTVRREP